jgi:hypothetical protein
MHRTYSMRQSRAPTVGSTDPPHAWEPHTDPRTGVADSEPPASFVLDKERALLWQGQHWCVGCQDQII